jgi:predicted heme/steroid binding protein/uncharacterized membrane protein
MNINELKQNDGRDGRPAYIGYKGKVYDVSTLGKWIGGEHMMRHSAGQDLTDVIHLAPHGEEMLKDLSVVDKLTLDSEEEMTKHKLRLFYRKTHPHPVTIHFPIALLIFAGVMHIAFLVVGKDSYLAAGLYALLFGTIMIFPAAGAGMLSWWINYDMKLTSLFRRKVLGTLMLLVSAVTASFIGVTIAPTGLYTLLVILNMPLVLFIAQTGGKIAWPQ